MSSMHLALYSEARALAQEGIDLSRESGLHYFAAFCSSLLGHVALAEGAYGAAQAHLEESVDLFRKSGNAIPVGESIVGLAYVARQIGPTGAGTGTPPHGAAGGGSVRAPEHGPAGVACPGPVADRPGRGGTGRRAVRAGLALSVCSQLALVRRRGGKADRRSSRYFAAEVAAAAQERGRARDLLATAKELLTELDQRESGPA